MPGIHLVSKVNGSRAFLVVPLRQSVHLFLFGLVETHLKAQQSAFKTGHSGGAWVYNFLESTPMHGDDLL